MSLLRPQEPDAVASKYPPHNSLFSLHHLHGRILLVEEQLYDFRLPQACGLLRAP